MTNWNPDQVQYSDVQGIEEFEQGPEGYVGANDIIGDIISEVARRRGLPRTAVAAAMRRLPNGVPGLRAGQHVAQRLPDVARAQVSPLPTMGLLASESKTFQWSPQRPFRMERLFLQSSADNKDFLVLAINVGADQQFVNSGALPGTMFLPNSFGAGLRGNTANPGVTLSIELQNLTLAGITVFGGIVGTSLTA